MLPINRPIWYRFLPKYLRQKRLTPKKETLKIWVSRNATLAPLTQFRALKNKASGDQATKVFWRGCLLQNFIIRPSCSCESMQLSSHFSFHIIFKAKIFWNSIKHSSIIAQRIKDGFVCRRLPWAEKGVKAFDYSGCFFTDFSSNDRWNLGANTGLYW